MKVYNKVTIVQKLIFRKQKISKKEKKHSLNENKNNVFFLKFMLQ